MIRATVRWLDERLGSSSFLKKTLRYLFPDHWSFLLGEVVLYSFVVLLGTGIYLTFFFEPSYADVVYQGGYAPLRGAHMTDAYRSTLQISFDTKGGLLIRQTHHWAANVFSVAIVLHMLRIFFTGAFRKPRDINVFVGVTLLALALVEGFAGYSLPDDLLSGMGLAIAYSVLVSVPLVGAWIGVWLWGGEFPGGNVFESRLYIAHVFIFPILIAILISLHLTIVARQKHSQFRGPGRTERNVVGVPLWPGYALRAFGLLLAVTAALFLLGGLVQINPVWLWGPYHPYLSTNGAQPDWYMGWLLGALRLMPPLEIHVAGYTILPNPFIGGVLFPGLVFTLLYAWPALERRFTGDHARHDLLDRPRDAPVRSGLLAALFTFVAVLFIAGSADQVAVHFQISYEAQLWIFRAAALVLPVLAFYGTRSVCRELAAREAHPLRGWTGQVVQRTPAGGFERAERGPDYSTIRRDSE